VLFALLLGDIALLDVLCDRFVEDDRSAYFHRALLLPDMWPYLWKRWNATGGARWGSYAAVRSIGRGCAAIPVDAVKHVRDYRAVHLWLNLNDYAWGSPADEVLSVLDSDEFSEGGYKVLAKLDAKEVLEVVWGAGYEGMGGQGEYTEDYSYSWAHVFDGLLCDGRSAEELPLSRQNRLDALEIACTCDDADRKQRLLKAFFVFLK
jgi:hypothetical protein